MFARHIFEYGISNDVHKQFTPIDENPAYIQSLPKSIILKEDITVDLALLDN